MSDSNLQALEANHQALNQAAPAGTMMIRPGVSFHLEEEARMPFEFFCFRHEGCAHELDNFLRWSGGRRSLLDLGSLFGMFSMSFCASEPGRRALAVDPSPQANRVLSRHIELNPDLDIEMVAAAVGDRDTVIHMRTEWIHLVAGSTQGEDTTTIKSRPADAILEETDFQPDVVKIDVEGYENKVLNGMRATLSRFKPDLHIEIHPQYLPDHGETGDDTFSLLREAGYVVFGMEGRPVTSMADLGVFPTVYCVHASGDRSGGLRT